MEPLFVGVQRHFQHDKGISCDAKLKIVEEIYFR